MRTVLLISACLIAFASPAAAGSENLDESWKSGEWKESPTGLFAIQIAAAAAQCKKESPDAPQGEFKQCVWREHGTVALPARWQTDGLEAIDCEDYSGSHDYSYRATVLLPDSTEFPLIIPNMDDCKRVQSHLHS